MTGTHSPRISTVSVFRDIERRIGGLVEGLFGRTFRSSVQPVELARKLAKEMDDHRTISIHRVYVPNTYTVYLNPADREQFAAYETQMCSELAEYLVEHARREGYSTATRPVVTLESEPDLTVGMFGIAVGADDGAADAQPPPPPAAEAAVADIPPAPPLPTVAVPSPPPASPPSIPVDLPAHGATMVYSDPDPEPEPVPEPAPEQPKVRERALLLWDGRDMTLDRSVTVIGRSSTCDIVVDDPNVSRRHAEIRRIGEGYSLVDLSSTNGTEVNGQRVGETSLMNGDVIGVGTTRLTFERRLG
jgi:FhaA, N-terminal domain/FHA domain